MLHPPLKVIALALLRVSGVSFAYDHKLVLDDISFQVSSNDFIGIIGPNGSGKSTLLKNLNRILSYQEGRVELDGVELSKIPYQQLACRMAYVGQDTQVTFAFSVEDVVLMGRHPHIRRFKGEGVSDWQVVRRVMEATRIAHLASRRITELSGGERQRVLLAKALAQEPDVLLLDEPTSHLDINHQLEFFDLLQELNTQQGLTVITVLHDLNLAALYCKKLLLLDQGSIFAFGNADEVLTRENIRAVYNTDVEIYQHPVNHRPQVMLLPKQRYRKVIGAQKDPQGDCLGYQTSPGECPGS
ncbi:MAG: heme ABC transporter ATP-binding protein [Limnochordia bacterium]|jgi:iron complex transport system ATP-binding protein|nr:heme ABC transporter ATP-binding protein [Limnochordia bacterium]MDD4518178.1 heme ABC transporter ATP-binding protein [Limnochordia bacterium]